MGQLNVTNRFYVCVTHCLFMQKVAGNNGTNAYLLQQQQCEHPCLVQTPPSIGWGWCRLQTDWQTDRPSPLPHCQLQTDLPIDQQGPAAASRCLTTFCTWHLLQLVTSNQPHKPMFLSSHSMRTCESRDRWSAPLHVLNPFACSRTADLSL